MEPKCSMHLLCIVLLTLSFHEVSGLGCRDEENRNVDWYVNYKLPRLSSSRPPYISEGKGYAYMSSSDADGSWKLSSKSITSQDSMLAKTLQDLMDNKENSSYLFYNDEPPEGFNGTTNGHLKGVVGFNKQSGFWLIYSIPKFGNIDGYQYPYTALKFGQSVICVSFNAPALNEICKQLLHTHPKVYDYQLTDEVSRYLDDLSRTIFSSKPLFNRKPPFKRYSTLTSSGKTNFVSFAKGGQFDDDIYKSIIAPSLQTSLATETWREGSGTYLPPACDSNYTVLDISSIKMVAKNGSRDQEFAFRSTDDHSKWAVSSDSQNWICIGDMNRMGSQAHRGGGSLCFQSERVATAYKSLISSSDKCTDV